METDACNTGVGAVIIQNKYPISFFSKKIAEKLSSTTIYVKEMYVITQAVAKWRHYLLGSHFIIKTNHRSLKYLLTQIIQTPEQQVFLVKLLGYDFSIVFKPGKENIVVDALSRSYEERENEKIIFSNRSEGEPGSLLSFSIVVNSLVEGIKKENEGDPKIQDIIHNS